MSYTPKRITPNQLAAAATTYYTATATANVQTIIKKVVFCNSTGSARTITLHLVPSGGSAAATNMLVSQRAINAYETYDCFEAQGQVMNPSDTIQAFSDSASAITIHGALVEVTK
jgi:hypothetical protein